MSYDKRNSCVMVVHRSHENIIRLQHSITVARTALLGYSARLSIDRSQKERQEWRRPLNCVASIHAASTVLLHNFCLLDDIQQGHHTTSHSSFLLLRHCDRVRFVTTKNISCPWTRFRIIMTLSSLLPILFLPSDGGQILRRSRYDYDFRFANVHFFFFFLQSHL